MGVWHLAGRRRIGGGDSGVLSVLGCTRGRGCAASRGQPGDAARLRE